MKGWTDIGSDINWEDYSGKWARKAADGSYYVLRFENMIEACGEREAKEMGFTFSCDVLRVELADLSEDTLRKALDCVFVNLEEDVEEEFRELATVEACVAHGYAQPLKSITGSKRPASIRAAARRYAEALMKDAQALEAHLERPVNAIGSTAREYGRGDLDSALERGPFDPAKNLMRKLQGLPPKTDG